MDKEQAIDLLDNLIGMIEDNQDNDYDTAFRMAIEALKAQLFKEGTTFDLISRQALCEYALNQKDKSVTPNDIMRFPPAKSEHPWILCSEKMPEEHEWIGTKQFGTTISDEVYVTFENPKGERFCKHLSFQNGKLSAFDKSTIDAFYKGSKPIAWMPLPEPYKPNNK